MTEESAVAQELKVFHVDDSLNEAQSLETTVNQEAGTLEAPAEHFSVYTVAELTNEIRANVEAEVKASDGTLTLLKDVETETYVTISSGTFVIDLDGNTWNCTYVYGMALNLQASDGSQVAITFKDSAGDGRFTTDGIYSVYLMNGYASAVFERGSYTGLYYAYDNVGDTLGTGYVYRNNSDGSWVQDTSVNTLYNVTVVAAPMKITAQPEDTAVLTGYAESPVLSVAAETVPADSGSSITYQWYRVGTGGGGTDKAIDEGTAASFSVPTGLTNGEYSYYCKLNCGDYSVNSQTATLYVSDGEGKFEVSSGTFTIDLNGNTWTCNNGGLWLQYGSDVTLKDSADGGVMTSGYGFQNTVDNSWVNQLANHRPAAKHKRNLWVYLHAHYERYGGKNFRRTGG